MTEVPDHLLRRSRERRAALGLGGDDAPAAAPATTESAAPATTGETAVAAASATPAVPAGPAFVEPVSKEGYLRVQEYKRKRIPPWALTGLLALPFWGYLYFGSFGERGAHEQAAPDGAAIYRANCASCHGQNGEGASGPALEDGSAKLTFPDEEQHKDWVRTGSQARRGQPYGDPNREGGQRVAATGGMPGFAATLSAEEIDAVVAYERDEL